jgi:peptide-methionine (S)-S-oxide reductase
MKPFRTVLLALLILGSTGCQSKNKQQRSSSEKIDESLDLQKLETAYFASGCFWCVEAIFESVKGVREVVSGYAGGTEPNPTYEQVGRGLTSHAEAVKVLYDPKVVSYGTLVKVFFGSHDPTTPNRQGPDQGAQYRSIAFYKNAQEKQTINDHIAELQRKKVYDSPIVTEVVAFSKFYEAEDYHQDYEKNNPNNPYVQGVSVPRLKRFQKKFPELLKPGSH